MSEHDEQKYLFRWAASCRVEYPELDMMFAVPNGGKRDDVTAARLKEEGVKAGVPDLFLPVARAPYHGAVIEMKFGKNGLEPEQKEWLPRLAAEGYATCVAYGWCAAARFLLRYLGVDAATVERLVGD